MLAGKLTTIILIVFFSCSGTALASGEILSFNDIEQEKVNIALELTGPIYRCFMNNDTEHPVFNGCVDWHSSVHATWALIAYTNITGDNRYVSTIKATLDKGRLDEEKQKLKENIKFEMPYGRAWFLKLCIEYEKLFEDDLFVEFGDEVADSLVDFYKATAPNPLTKSYNNPTWALLNLLDYGRYRNRPDLIAFVKTQVYKYYYKDSASCRFDDSRPNFMAVCTNWAWLVGSVVEKEQFIPWVYNFMPPFVPMEPLKKPEKAHEYGLNFSRCWGLLRMYQLSEREEYLEAFTNTFLESYLNRNHWDGEYKKVGHWVAQFGLFALMPLFATPSDAPLANSPQ